MATIVVFASSLSIASTLVVVKAIEIRSRNKNFLLRLLNKLDSGCEKCLSSLKFRTLQIIQTVRYILLVESKNIYKDLVYRLQERIAHELKVRHEMIMTGRKEITQKGSVSFYLKKITEEKGNGKRGKIEQSL